MKYNLNATNDEVIKDLIKGKGWDFLYVRDWEGKKTNALWWNYYKGGWHDIWNQFLLNLGTIYDKLPNVRETYTPLDRTPLGEGRFEYTYVSKSNFIFHFLLKCSIPDSNVVEWAPELNEINKLGYKQVFEFDENYKSKSPHGEVDEHGDRTWKKKINYDLSKIPDNVWFKTKSLKERFYIIDSKSKYGTLRVSLSFYNEEISRLEYELEQVSKFTCEKCGKQPKDSKGKHIIWQSLGYWVEQFCKKCARLSCYETRNINYKDSLLIGKPFNSKETISGMMKKHWSKITEEKNIELWENF